MNFNDIFALAWRNLKQAKLRTALTVIGVVVGVAAIVTMVSFGLGLQNNLLKEAFARIDFFTSITVFGPSADMVLAMREGTVEEAPKENEAPAPTPEASPSPTPPISRILDDAMLKELAQLNGVRYVLPLFNTANYVQFGGRTRRTSIGGAPLDVEYNPRFKYFIAGQHFSGEAAHEAVLTERLVTRLISKQAPRFTRSGRDRAETGGGPFRPISTKTEEERKREAEAVIGQEITILTLPGANISGESVFGIPLIGSGPAEELDGQSTDPFANFERHPYKIVGVLKSQEGIDINFASSASFYIPLEQAKQFREANRDPMEQMGEMLMGDTGYQSAEVRVSDLGQLENIKSEIKKRGFNFWNIGNQIEEIRRVFLIVNASLALIGGLALLVASFGISNTMIMAIRERTREIGVMKAIGGSDGEIMRIFFVEASLIGFFGGALGVLCGWGIDRVANALANRWITRQAGQAIRYIDFFSIPWYLSAGAVLFAVIISLAAAIYPAMRAARVDPIKALRYE
jgi:ABC-type antimicrobial peptide transport system permease subunit